MQENFCYIGSFEMTSGKIIICDPYTSGLLSAEEEIPPLNRKSVEIKNLQNGIFDAYHHKLENGAVAGLVCVNKDYPLNSLDMDVNVNKKILQCGYASSNLGSAIVLVDTDYFDNPQYSYYNVLEDAIFKGTELLNALSDSPYPEEIHQKFRKKLEKKKQKEITGKEILDILKASVIWDGFSSPKIQSNLWSKDILKKAHESYMNSAPIKGGVVSYAKPGFLKVSAFIDSTVDNQVYAIYVQLRPQNIAEASLLK